MIVEALWRFPIKSLGGERLDSVTIGPSGFAFDRHWGLVDLASGFVLSAKREANLLLAAARIDGHEVVVTLPDGSDTADDAVLSSWLGREVALRVAGDVASTYEAPADFETESGSRVWRGPPGAFHDSASASVSLVSRGALSGWDPRRFRSNVVLGSGREEDWVGRQFSLGTSRLQINKRLSRCVMVTRPQPGIERDLEVLRTINRDRGSVLAVGATVIAGGQAAVGDALSPTGPG